MDGFGSINNLLDQNGQQHGTGQGAAPALSVASDEKEFELQKKIIQIEQKEKEIETKAFAEQIGIPHIDLDKFPVTQESLRQIPLKQAKELGAVCFYKSQDQARIGALDPQTDAVQKFVKAFEQRTHTRTVVYVVSQKSFDRIVEMYNRLPIIEGIIKDIKINAESLSKVKGDVNDFQSLKKLLSQANTTDLVVYILGAGLKLDASDIHVEAEQNKIVIRFRLDGILHDAADLPKEVFHQLISRVKLVAGLKINITNKPQDGRFTINLPDGDVDVRVSTMPTVFGESIVMRLLHQNRKGLTLESIGLRGYAFDKLMHQIQRPNGMIITTGPTGSGKTTTLYAIMQIINKPGVKIITLEDPVEYKMEGVNQSQVDHEKGYDFATGLKSILRQDPDIAMVGEIRDLETAQIAIQTALTGHLLLSTIHTNSAAGAIPRFLSMGVKQFLLAPALNAIIGQRLVRRICEKCKKEVQLKPEEQKHVDKIIASMPEKENTKVENKPKQFFIGNGCDACNGLGYKGRVGIYEIMIINNEIKHMILAGQVSEYDMEAFAVKHGMLTMVQDGILKVLDGITSLSEVFRVIE